MLLFCRAFSSIFPPQLHLVLGVGSLKYYRVQCDNTTLPVCLSRPQNPAHQSAGVCSLSMASWPSESFSFFPSPLCPVLFYGLHTDDKQQRLTKKKNVPLVQKRNGPAAFSRVDIREDLKEHSLRSQLLIFKSNCVTTLCQSIIKPFLDL